MPFVELQRPETNVATPPPGKTTWFIGTDGTPYIKNSDGSVHSLMGNVGPAGPPGRDGINGATGTAGSIGLTGAQGVAGLNGTNGTNGLTGQRGDTGAAGQIGLPGVAGSTGPAGPPGPVQITCYALANSVSTTLITPQNTNLVFPVAANEVWFVDYQLSVTSAAAGYCLAVNVPLGALIEGWATSNNNNTTSYICGRFTGPSILTAALQTAAITGSAHCWARIKNAGVAGFATLQYASKTAGQTTTVLSGSTMSAMKSVEV